jgi:SAM-dependent MidA family methyltransferase
VFLRHRPRSDEQSFLRVASEFSTEEIDSAVARLLGQGQTEMGKLFKVMAIADPSLGNMPGFE